MTTIKIETETITTDLTPSEAAAKIKEALGIAEWPQDGDVYWTTADGVDFSTRWDDDDIDRYRLSIGNCSPTQEGLARYKADEAKKAAIVAIRKHRDKTFGVFEPEDGEHRWYGVWARRELRAELRTMAFAGIVVPFRTDPDIRRSFAECGEHWEVLR